MTTWKKVCLALFLASFIALVLSATIVVFVDNAKAAHARNVCRMNGYYDVMTIYGTWRWDATWYCVELYPMPDEQGRRR